MNNGKITSENDAVSGETVTYTYDSLNRLASATSSVNPGWGQSFGYDGFGNLTTVSVTKGSAPSLSVSYNASTNRRSGDSADSNGNIFQNGITAYDASNRITSANITNGTARYSYAPGNKRIWRGTWVSGSQTVDELTFYSAGGAKLCAYNLSTSGSDLRAVSTGYYEYFGGKLIKNATGYVGQDRLGSIGKYFPYGQERPSATANGKEKFATYTRDAETGLDYAQNRYHSSGDGRFLSPDPYQASAGPSDPGSWNRYAYASGDPVNGYDPSGLLTKCPAGTHGGPTGFSCEPDVVDCGVRWWLPECGGFTAEPGSNEDPAAPDTAAQERAHAEWMNNLANSWNAGLAVAANMLTIGPCAALFNGAGGSAGMSALGVADPAQLLNLYVDQGWMTYSSSYRPNGVQPGGAEVSFSSFNQGGVTTLATNSYTLGGVRRSVKSITMNVHSWAFTGMAYSSTGGFTTIGAFAPSLFGGLSQPEVLALAIIHELLHAVSAIPLDGAPPNATPQQIQQANALSMANSALVRGACF